MIPRRPPRPLKENNEITTSQSKISWRDPTDLIRRKTEVWTARIDIAPQIRRRDDFLFLSTTCMARIHPVDSL